MFDPADLRAGRVVLLLDLEWGGTTLRIGEEPCSITGVTGDTLVYAGGLDAGGDSRSVSLFADADSPPSLDCSVWVPPADVGGIPDVIEAGHIPPGSAAAVYAALPDADVRVLLFRGVLQDVDYGAAGDPLTFTVEADVEDRAGRTHPETARIGTDTLGDSAAGGAGSWRWDDEADLEWYPLVLGKPGSGDGAAFGSPAFGLNITGSTNGALVAGHPVLASSVYIETFDDNAQSGTHSILDKTDLLGRRFSMVDVGTPGSPWWAEGTEQWVDWGASSGGLAKADGSLLRGAGDVLAYLARLSSMPWDLPAVEAVAPLLNPYLIDAAIVPEPGERLSPWLWAREHVLPLLPISTVVGPRGLRLVVWRPDATTSEAVAALDAGHNCSRASSVAWSGLDEIANELRLDYGIDARRNRPTKSRTLSGWQPTLDDVAAASPLGILRESVARYGYRPRSAQRAAAVWDDDTAARVLLWQARRYALPTRAVEYDAEPGLGWLQPGDVVTVTDADLSLTDRVVLVEAAALTGASVRLSLRLY